MQPRYSQSSRENSFPFSGTSPLAFYKEVPPPPRALGLYEDIRIDRDAQWNSKLVVLSSLSFFFSDCIIVDLKEKGLNFCMN